MVHTQHIHKILNGQHYQQKPKNNKSNQMFATIQTTTTTTVQQYNITNKNEIDTKFELQESVTLTSVWKEFCLPSFNSLWNVKSVCVNLNIIINQDVAK